VLVAILLDFRNFIVTKFILEILMLLIELI
jgi:hypothetical protein